MSIATWVYVVPTDTLQVIISKANGFGDGEWAFYITSVEKAAFYCFDDSTGAFMLIRSEDALTTGWHFVVATYSGSGAASGFSLYVDGTVESNPYTYKGFTYTAMENTTANVALGAYANATAKLADKLDNTALFDKELSAAEVTTLWNSGNGTEDYSSLSANLISQWKMNDDSSVDHPIQTEVVSLGTGNLG